MYPIIDFMVHSQRLSNDMIIVEFWILARSQPCKVPMCSIKVDDFLRSFFMLDVNDLPYSSFVEALTNLFLLLLSLML